MAAEFLKIFNRNFILETSLAKQTMGAIKLTDLTYLFYKLLGQNLSNLPGSTDGPGLNFLEKDSCNSTSVTKDLQSIDMFEHNLLIFRTSNFEFFDYFSNV